jgi:SAM-dependent methyltransferase
MRGANKQEYENVFFHRGTSYDRAMREHPDARHIEFSNLMRHTDIEGLKYVADVPSGGGYLQPHLGSHTTLHSYDPAAPFSSIGRVNSIDLSEMSLLRTDYDLIISLASIHHIAEKRSFARAMIEHCRVDGQIVLADVVQGSKVARFLDTFVGHHNNTGHQGLYLSSDDPFDFGRGEKGVEDVKIELLAAPWKFESAAQMARFCKLLFGMTGLEERDMVSALGDFIGLEFDEAGVSLMWELTYIFLEVVEPCPRLSGRIA